MGNQMCCDQNRKEDGFLEQMQPGDNKLYADHLQEKYNSVAEEEKQVVDANKIKEEITIPTINYQVAQTINKHEFYKHQFENAGKQLWRFGDDVFEGHLDQQKRPKGFGKMYKNDGSVFIGHFTHGKAHGKGAYIFSNGSFYNGQFRNNLAQSDNSHYESEQLIYTGGFKNNTFSGKGHEKGKNHEFIGEYSDGHKTHGQFWWYVDNDKYTYEGTFNFHNEFHGEGILTQPKGVYQGFFVKGKKEGEGVYKSVNGIVYSGEYKNGQKNGHGQLTKDDGSIAYDGQFQNGLPHGKGWVMNDGVKIEAIWKEGVDSSLIKDQK